MNNSHAKKGITLRYSTEFSCIGTDCPDNCCHDWGVNVERETYDNLKKVLSAEVMKSSFTKTDKGNQNEYARIVMKENGDCTFLDASDRLCNLHKRFGESCLSQTCKLFPRQLAMIGDTIELAMNVSCPEVARRCLLEEDATGIVEFEPEELLEKGVAFSYMQSENPANHYLTYVNDFREIMLHLLANRNYPFESRLFIMLYLARKVTPYIYDGVTDINEEMVGEELDNLLTPGAMDDLHQQLEDLPRSLDFSMSVIQNVMMARFTNKSILNQLINNILNAHGIKTAISDETIEFEVAQGSLADAFKGMIDSYQSRRDGLREKYGTDIELYFENYCRNYWFKNLFVKSPSLLAHMQDLVVRLAVVKFLFFNHPDLDELVNSDALSPEQAKKRLDEVAVKTFYQFSRGVEHDVKFLGNIQSELTKQEMDSFAHFVLLLKF